MNNPYIPKYNMGGMVGQGGLPEPSGMVPGAASAGLAPEGGAPAAAADSQQLDMQVNQFVSQHPEQVAQMRDAIMTEVQSGDMDMQELNQLVQLATVAAQNPQMYPYIRQHAIQQGIATEQDLPEQYDQGLVFALMLAGRAAQQSAGSGESIPSMEKGGSVPGKNKKGGVIIEAHEGEYVIPKNVVAMKGKEFFDNLVEKYKQND